MYAFHGPSLHHSISMGQLWAALAAPEVQLIPHWEYVLTEPANPSKMWQPTFFTKSSLGAMTR